MPRSPGGVNPVPGDVSEEPSAPPVFADVRDVPEAVRRRLLLWRNAPDVRCRMVHQEEISEEDHARWLAGLEREGSLRRVRVAHWRGVPFGVVALDDLDLVAGSASWGLYIGEPDYRGRGLGKRMLEEILRWGFEELGLYRLYTSVLSDNVEALGLYLKRGFRIEGNWREHVRKPDGGRVDLIWVGMLRSAEEARRATGEGELSA